MRRKTYRVNSGYRGAFYTRGKFRYPCLEDCLIFAINQLKGEL